MDKDIILPLLYIQIQKTNQDRGSSPLMGEAGVGRYMKGYIGKIYVGVIASSRPSACMVYRIPNETKIDNIILHNGIEIDS